MPDTMMPTTSIAPSCSITTGTAGNFPQRATSGTRRAFRVPTPVRRMASPLIIVAVWQAASAAGLISPRVLASPAAILAAAWDLAVSGPLLTNLGVSLARVCVGLAIAIGVGVPLALAAGLSRIGEDTVDASLQMLRTLPHLALVPLFILWFGIREEPKIALVALGALLP